MNFSNIMKNAFIDKGGLQYHMIGTVNDLSVSRRFELVHNEDAHFTDDACPWSAPNSSYQPKLSPYGRALHHSITNHELEPHYGDAFINDNVIVKGNWEQMEWLFPLFY